MTSSMTRNKAKCKQKFTTTTTMVTFIRRRLTFDV